MDHLGFKPLAFQRIKYDTLRPPISDNDHTRGNDYIRGELLSLGHANTALRLAVRFVRGPDGQEWRSPQTEVEFQLTEDKGRYIGGIVRQAPDNFCYMSGAREAVITLGKTSERPPALAGRTRGTFFCNHTYGRYPTTEFSVTVMIRRGFFGGWKEIVIEVPKKDLYVAYP